MTLWRVKRYFMSLLVIYFFIKPTKRTYNTDNRTALLTLRHVPVLAPKHFGVSIKL